jgi:hypothetical protein
MEKQLVPLNIPKLGASVIHLTKGRHCLVSSQDWKWLSERRWYAQNTTNRGGRYPYAARAQTIDGKLRTILMHREILVAGDGLVIDHANHNTLDNRRCNLRLTSESDNCHNRVKLSGCHSRFIGVTRDKKNPKWLASIKREGKRYHLGGFDDEEEAARARDEWARRLYLHPTLNFN